MSAWQEIRVLVREKRSSELIEKLDALSPGDVARALTRLDDHDRYQLLTLIEPEEAADLIEELADAQGADIIEDLPARDAAAIVEEMESDHRADLLGEMDEEDAEAILSRMDPEEAEDARRLLEYDEDSAGGIMVTEFVSYPQEATVGDVLRDMRKNAARYSDYGVQYAYVNTKHGTLVGVVRLPDLLLAPAEKALQDIMVANPVYVLGDTPLDELTRLFDRFPFWKVPVTDADGRMLGVARRADAEEALGEEHEKTLLRFGGIIGGEELRSMPVSERAGRRLVWLGLNVAPSFVAASMILLFADTIDAMGVALVFFIPIVGNMCGCTGNQAVAVSIRELALGLIQPSDFVRVWLKEVSVGVINGIVLGMLIGGAASLLCLFLWPNSPFLGVVIGVAFAVNTVVAVSLGGLVPLALRALNLDPALGAPLILTTFSDMFGLLFVFGLAYAALQLGLL